MKQPRPNLRLYGSFGIFAAGLTIGWMVAPRHEAGSQAGDTAQISAAVGNSFSGRRVTDTRENTVGSGSAARPLAKAGTPEFSDSVRSIFQETSEEKRMFLFGKMLDRATPSHLAEVVGLIRENDLRGNDSSGEWSRLWARWGETDAPGALQFIAGKDWTGWGRTAPEEAKKKAMTFWAQTDPLAAVRYFEQSGEIEKGDRSLVSPIVRGLANQDPEAAADWIFKSGLGMRDEYRSVIDALRRQKGMEGADAWFDAASLSGAPTKDLAGLAQAIVSSRQDFDPAQAASWVEKHLTAPWLEQSGVVDSTARALADKDPEMAMNWANRNEMPSAAGVSFMEWLRKDSGNATAWLDTHSDSPVYATAANIGSQFLARNDPAAATRIAQSIPDEQQRARALTMVQAIQANIQAQREADKRTR